MSAIKGGRKPLSERPKSKALSLDALFGNTFDVPVEIQAELDAKGLEGRWVSRTKLGQNYGHHPRGWRPYKPDHLKDSNLDFLTGTSPDGYLGRGTMILAVRSKEVCERHREVIASRLQTVSDLEKGQATRLRQKAAEVGLNTNVVEGHGED